MEMSNEILMRGPVERIFALAAEVERWPEILPHYRWVKLIDQDGNRKIVEMAARRDWIPVQWTSVQELQPEANRIIFRHIKGVTRGMYVEWRLAPTAEGVHVSIYHTWQPAWPLMSEPAARLIGELFVSNIAGKTLRRIGALVEQEGRMRPQRSREPGP